MKKKQTKKLDIKKIKIVQLRSKSNVVRGGNSTPLNCNYTVGCPGSWVC